jgi:hypothetical protein
MARKVTTRRSGSSGREPVKLTSRLAGAFIGLLIGCAIGAFFVQKVLRTPDSRLWVLTSAGCGLIFAAIGFFKAPADLDWNRPIDRK